MSPSNLGKGPGGDRSAVPQRTPRQQVAGVGATDGNANSTALEQQVTKLAETVDALLAFVNNAFAPTPSTRTKGTGSVTTTKNTTGNLTLRGAIDPDLNVTRDVNAGRNVSAGAAVSGKSGVFNNPSKYTPAVIAVSPSTPAEGEAAYAAIPAGGGLGLRVTNQSNTNNVYTIDATGKTVGGVFDASGNSVVRGNLRVTGSVTQATQATFAPMGPTPAAFNYTSPLVNAAGRPMFMSNSEAGDAGDAHLYGDGSGNSADSDNGPTIPSSATPQADPDGPADLGSLTVDGPTQVNNTLGVTQPATFSDITSSGMVNADMVSVNGTQIATDQQITNDSNVAGNLRVGGMAFFGDADSTPLAYASVVDGTINGVNITASGALAGANIVTPGDVQAATAHIATAAIPTINGNTLTYGTGNFTTLNAGTISSGGTQVLSGGNVTANDVSTVTLEASGASTLKATSVTSLSASGNIAGATATISGNTSTGALTATSVTSTGAISGTSASISGVVGGGSLNISGNASIGGTSTLGTLNAGATTLNSATVTFALGANSLNVTNNTATKTLTVSNGETINGGSTINGALQANNGIITNDVVTTTMETSGPVSVGTNFSAGGTGLFTGAVTTPNIIAAAGYLTSLSQAQYWDTNYVANANKQMNSPVIWNVSGTNGILGTGIGSTAYASYLDWAYVPPVAGSLQSITGFVYTNTAATVTYSLYINGTSAFSGTTTTTAATRKYFALTSTRGALTFAAGATLALYIKASAAQTQFYSIISPHVYL